MVRIGKYVIGRVDVAGGAFTYGQRIALGDIFRNDSLSAYAKMKAAFIELYGWSPRLLPAGPRYRAIKRTMLDFKGWLDKEQKLLSHDPEPDQIQAGIKDLIAHVGDMGTIKAIAKTYGLDPDVVVEWPYSKVFGILYTDLEEYKYEKRYNQVIDAKYRKHTRR